MANQNIGTPRFIVDYIQYFQANGLARNWYDPTQTHYFWNAAPPFNNFANPETVKHLLSTIGLNPVHDFTFTGVADMAYSQWNHSIRMDKSFPIQECNIVGLLGHNMKTTGGEMGFQYHYYTTASHWGDAELTDDFVINATTSGNRFSADFNGFSFHSCNGGNVDEPVHANLEPNIRNVPNPMDKTYKPGSLLWGRYYDMPHSPELSLTMSHEYDGIKKQETSGGSTLGYVDYYKPPDWGDLQAWQLDGWDRKYSGRRVWDLTFNHLSDSDIEPYHYHMDSTPPGASQPGNHPNWNEDGNWFTNVIHYTNGGQLPFVFCPDPARYDSNGTLISGTEYSESTRTIPEFAICRFDMKTFKREQVANGIYNIKVKIKESW